MVMLVFMFEKKSFVLLYPILTPYGSLTQDERESKGRREFTQQLESTKRGENPTRHVGNGLQTQDEFRCRVYRVQGRVESH